MQLIFITWKRGVVAIVVLYVQELPCPRTFFFSLPALRGCGEEIGAGPQRMDTHRHCRVMGVKAGWTKKKRQVHEIDRELWEKAASGSGLQQMQLHELKHSSACKCVAFLVESRLRIAL